MQVAVYLQASLIALIPVAAVLACATQLSPLSPAIVESLAFVPKGVGYTLVCAAVACVIALWLFNRERRLGKLTFWVSWWMSLALSVVAAALMVPHHPCWAIAALSALGPVLIYPLQHLGLPGAAAVPYLQVVWVASALSALGCFAAWLPWILRGFAGRQKWTDWPPPVRRLVERGTISWKCAFVMWAAPPAIGLELVFVALLCWVRKCYTSVDLPREGLTLSCRSRDKVLLSSMKQVAGWLFALLMLIWIQAVMSSTGQQEFNQTREDMSDEVVGLAFLTFVVMSLWVLDTVGPVEVAAAVQQSTVAKETAKLLQSDWVRAFLFLIVGVPLVMFAAGESIYRWLCGRHKDGEVRPLFMWTVEWRWTSILVKASWLGLAYVSILVGIGKVTTVLLAIVNHHFSGWPVFTVSAVMFVIALVIFMFPASPGPPVYIVMGIVICSSAEKQGWTFTEGLLWATFVAYAMKLAFTAAAQKVIGEAFAKSDRIRHLVGIQTPYMRAIERILRERTISVAKVALLVGGPDWPVAVLCGMLRLSIWSIQLCITPVLLQSIFPSVLAGALFLVRNEAHTKTNHGMAEVTLVIAGAMQLGMGVIAFYYVQEVLERDYKELTESRLEDTKLEELEAKANAIDRAFWREASWELVPQCLKLALISGLLSIQASIVMLANHEACFKKFNLMSSVEDDLGGRVMSIVKPLGWIAMGFAMFDAMALGAFYAWSHNGRARNLLDMAQVEAESKPII